MRTAAKGHVAIAGTRGRVYAYWHIVPAVRVGQQAVAYRTVVGHIATGWGHVHFRPYRDTTAPKVTGLGIAWKGLAIRPLSAVSGRTDLVLTAFDDPPLRVGGACHYLIYLARGWHADSVEPGFHTLEAVACDIRGNCSSSSTLFWTGRAI